MNENKFKPGDIVKHVNKEFDIFNLYVVKRLENGSYKCRYRRNDIFMSDEFDDFELKEAPIQ